MVFAVSPGKGRPYMSSFCTCSPRELPGNLIRRIAEEWMLVTAGSPADGVATMTVNWGAMGYLWHRDMAMVVIRHSRNTLPYMERSGGFSLSLFSPKYREQLTFCGQNSGRDVDKIAHCGFTTAYEDGIPYFTQADTVLLCRTMYTCEIEPGRFLDRELFRRWYEEGVHKGDMHRMFLAHIQAVLQKKA